MTKTVSKALAFLLAVLMLMTVFPISVFADTLKMTEVQEPDFSEEQPEDREEFSTEEEDSEPLEALEEIQRVNPPAEIMAKTTPKTVTVAQAQERLNTLKNLFVGKAFTVSGTACKADHKEDDNCANVVKTEWCKNLVGMGTIDPGNFPYIYDYDGSRGSYTGWQCYGFACFAHWYIFAQKNTDNLVGKLIKTGSLTYSTLKSALPGDVLQTNDFGSNGHAMIFMSCNSSGYTVLDCNGMNKTDGYCVVKVNTYSYSSSKQVSITSVENYDRNSTSTVKVTGVSVSPTSASLTVGATKTLTATVSPSNATNKAVTWSSTNTGVATVSSSGVVTAKAAGSATIKATTSDGGYTASCSVTVNPKTYTISYDANGGGGAPGAQTKTAGVALKLSSTIPIRSGYTFKGWQAPSTTKKGDWTTTKPTSGSYETGYKFFTWGCECKDAKQWGENYDDDDYTFAVRMTKANAIQHIKDNPKYFGTYSPSLVRYFWLIESTKKGAPDSDGDWAYKVGENSHVTVNYIGLNAKEELDNSIVGTRSIWKTTFWFESEVYRQDVTVPGKIYQPGDSYTTDANVTLTAVWEKSTPETYMVIYNVAGGEGGPDTQIKTQGVTLKLSTTIPTRPGYTFNYWEADDGTIYEPGADYTKDETTVLTAEWSMVLSWTIKYDANGGIGAPSNSSKSRGITLKLSTKVPTRSGYTFLYWQATDGTIYAPGDNYTKDETTTLKAIWEKNVEENTPQIIVSNAKGRPGEEVTVTISLKNNPGNIGIISLPIAYDANKLTLVALNGENIPNGGWQIKTNPIWMGGPTGYNGVVLTAIFKINANADFGETVISVENKFAIRDFDTEEVVDFSVVSGTLNISNRIAGDVNGDGEVDSADLLRLHKYLAGYNVVIDESASNVNGDGEVDSADLLRLHKFLAGYSVQLV